MSDSGFLGRASAYPATYDPSLLFPISRSESRKALGIGESLPFTGADLWTAYEFSWLLPSGLPQVAMVEFTFPSTSPNLIESKSFKLYLNSYFQSRFADTRELLAQLKADLSRASGGEVSVALFPVTANHRESLPQQAGFRLLDNLPVVCEHYRPEPSLLTVLDGVGEERLSSYLFRSVCPVTGQPDWASIHIHYRGQRVDEESLLRYLVSFRNHAGFHEECVERIFVDLQQAAAPEFLMVYARFLRRGGLDINPLRATEPVSFPPFRDPRQ